MRGRTALFILFLILSNIMVTAQSNDVIDDLLAEERATFGNSIYLVLAAVGAIHEDATIQTAIDALKDTDWHIPIRDANMPIRLGEISFVIMKSLDIAGGLFYSIFPGPRYAARELKYLGFYTGRYSPGRYLSGEEVLRILGNALTWKER